MKPVILWTDAVVLLLVLGSVLYAWKVFRTPHLANTWRKAFASAPGAAAATVVGLFVLIGIVDSLHYRSLLAGASGAEAAYAPETKSLFDAFLARQVEGREKSYSAPLAWHAHEKEAVTENGITQRVYPRLAHGGTHLQAPGRDWAADVTTRVLAGVVLGLVATAVLALLLVALAAWRSRQPVRNVLHAL